MVSFYIDIKFEDTQHFCPVPDLVPHVIQCDSIHLHWYLVRERENDRILVNKRIPNVRDLPINPIRGLVEVKDSASIPRSREVSGATSVAICVINYSTGYSFVIFGNSFFVAAKGGDLDASSR